MQAVSAATPKQFRSATKMCGGGLGQGGTACAAHSPRYASPDFLVHQSDLPNHFQFCFNSIWKKLEISNANHPTIQPMKLIQPIARMIYCAGPINTLCNHVKKSPPHETSDPAHIGAESAPWVYFSSVPPNIFSLSAPSPPPSGLQSSFTQHLNIRPLLATRPSHRHPILSSFFHLSSATMRSLN